MKYFFQLFQLQKLCEIVISLSALKCSLRILAIGVPVA
jgi:hypothetical protein